MLEFIDMAYRTPETEAAYEAHKKLYAQSCDFCELESGSSNQIVETYDSFYVIKNIFPYANWDSHTVTNHLMLVPKRHLESLRLLSAEEGKVFFEVVSRYEDEGYSLYARSPTNKSKTIAHQHTHLIHLSTEPSANAVLQ